MATQDVGISPGQPRPTVAREPNPSVKGFHLHHHQVQRAREHAGHAGVAVLHSFAAHADNASGKCHTTARTISRESGVGIKKLPGVIAKLDAGGVIEKRRRTRLERSQKPGGAFEFTIVRTDGPRGFLPVSQDWMKAHATLSPACMDAHALIRSLGNGCWKFEREFDKVRLMLGVSRATLYRLLKVLAEHGLVRHYLEAGGHWWELPELQPPDDAPIKRFLATRPQAVAQPVVSVSKLTPDPAPEAVPTVSKLSHELCKSKPTLLPNSRVVEGFEVLELDKNNPSLKQDVRSAKNAESHPPISPVSACGGPSSSEPKPETRPAEWPKVAIAHIKAFGFRPPVMFKIRYAEACARYTEEIVMACFDTWAHGDTGWVKRENVGQPLFAFFKQLPSMTKDAMAFSKTEISERPAPPLKELGDFSDEVDHIVGSILAVWPRIVGDGSGDLIPIEVSLLEMRVDKILRTMPDVDGPLLVEAAKAYFESHVETKCRQRRTPQWFFGYDRSLDDEPWKAYAKTVRFRERLDREEAAKQEPPRVPPVEEQPSPITCEPRRHSNAKALPPLTHDEYDECWAIIDHRLRELKPDGPPLAKRRVNGILRLAKSNGFLSDYDPDLCLELDEFDNSLRQFADAYVWDYGVSITAEEGLKLIVHALRDVMGYDDDSLMGTMGPDADFPNCPRAVYAETHGGVM